MPIWGYIGAGALITGFLGGWTIRDWKADADILKGQEKAEEIREKAEERWYRQADFYLDQLSSLSSQSVINRESIRTIYRDVEVPAECAVPDTVVSVLNNAVRTANASVAGELAAPMSPASTPPGAVD